MPKLNVLLFSLFSVWIVLDACLEDFECTARLCDPNQQPSAAAVRTPGLVCLEMQNLELIALNPHTKWKKFISTPGDAYTSTKVIVAPNKSRVLLVLQNLTWSSMDRYNFDSGKCLHGKLRIYLDPGNNLTFIELCNEHAPIFLSKGTQLKMEEEVVRYAVNGLTYTPYYTTVTPVEESAYSTRTVYKIVVRQSVQGMITQISALYEKGAVLTWEIAPPKLTEFSMCSVTIIQPCASSSDVLKMKYSGRLVENSTEHTDGDAEPKAVPRDVITGTNEDSEFVAHAYRYAIGHEKIQQKRLLRGETLQFFYEMNGDSTSKWSVSWECHVYANKELDEMETEMFKPVYLTEHSEAVRTKETHAYGCAN